MVRRLEVAVEEGAGDALDQRGVAVEGRLHRRGELADGAGLPQLSRGGRGVPRPGRVVLVGHDLPHPVGEQVPERELGVVRLTGRAELDQQVAEPWLDVGVLERSAVAGHPPAEGEEDEQRLVRGALAIPLPHLQAGEGGEGGVVGHFRDDNPSNVWVKGCQVSTAVVRSPASPPPLSWPAT